MNNLNNELESINANIFDDYAFIDEEDDMNPFIDIDEGMNPYGGWYEYYDEESSSYSIHYDEIMRRLI